MYADSDPKPGSRESTNLFAWLAFIFIVPILLLACLVLQAENPPPPPWKVKIEITLIEKDEEHHFVVSGTTDLPQGVDIRARIYAVQVVDDPRGGKREDEEPLVWKGDSAQPAFKPVLIQQGSFKEEVYRFNRKPWPIRYRARLHYDPNLQTNAVLDTLGRNKWSAHGDLRVGTSEEYATRLAETVKDVTRDVITLQALFREFEKEFTIQLTTFDEPRWRTWKAGWYERVERLKTLNDERWSLWTLYLERLAKMSVGGMCELLRRVLVGSGEVFANASLTADERARILKSVRKIVSEYPNYLGRAIDQMGLNIPLEKDLVVPILKAYETGLEPLRAFIELGKGDPSETRAQVRSACIKSLLKLSPLFKNRKLAYKHASDLSLRFRRMLDLVERGASRDMLRAALKEHDTAYRNFKNFVGVK